MWEAKGEVYLPAAACAAAAAAAAAAQAEAQLRKWPPQRQTLTCPFAVAEAPVVVALLNLQLVALFSLAVYPVRRSSRLLEQEACVPLPPLVEERSVLRVAGVGPKRSAALLAVDVGWRHLHLELQMPLFRSSCLPQTLVLRALSGGHPAPMPACSIHRCFSSCLLQTGLLVFGSSHAAVPASGRRHGHPRTIPVLMFPEYYLR